MVLKALEMIVNTAVLAIDENLSPEIDWANIYI